MPLYEPNVTTEKAYFALSCFWAPDAQFGCAPGVIHTKVGYTGGTTKNPTYRNLGDHTETVELEYDNTKASYKTLLDMFWHNHDPTVRQSRQYMSAIFYCNENQKLLAEESKKELQKSLTNNIVTEIVPLEHFYEAENYHQKYKLRNHPKVFHYLGLDGKDLIGSHVAARLNGYLGGYSSLASFNAEWEKFGISEECANYVREQISRGNTLSCST